MGDNSFFSSSNENHALLVHGDNGKISAYPNIDIDYIEDNGSELTFDFFVVVCEL